MKLYRRKNNWLVWRKVSRLIFRYLAAAVVMMAAIEYLEPGFVTNWFNPAWLLPWLFLSAILPTSPHYD